MKTGEIGAGGEVEVRVLDGGDAARDIDVAACEAMVRLLIVPGAGTMKSDISCS